MVTTCELITPDVLGRLAKTAGRNDESALTDTWFDSDAVASKKHTNNTYYSEWKLFQSQAKLTGTLNTFQI